MTSYIQIELMCLNNDDTYVFIFTYIKIYKIYHIFGEKFLVTEIENL